MWQPELTNIPAWSSLPLISLIFCPLCSFHGSFLPSPVFPMIITTQASWMQSSAQVSYLSHILTYLATYRVDLLLVPRSQISKTEHVISSQSSPSNVVPIRVLHLQGRTRIHPPARGCSRRRILLPRPQVQTLTSSSLLQHRAVLELPRSSSLSPATTL